MNARKNKKVIQRMLVGLILCGLMGLLPAQTKAGKTFQVQKPRQVTFPDSLRQAGIEGKVVVKVLVDEQGRYLEHKVLESSHPLFLNEVEAFISYNTFKPAVFQGEKVKAWITIPFNFVLGNKTRNEAESEDEEERKGNPELYKRYN